MAFLFSGNGAVELNFWKKEPTPYNKQNIGPKWAQLTGPMWAHLIGLIFSEVIETIDRT